MKLSEQTVSHSRTLKYQSELRSSRKQIINNLTEKYSVNEIPETSK